MLGSNPSADSVGLDRSRGDVAASPFRYLLAVMGDNRKVRPATNKIPEH